MIKQRGLYFILHTKLTCYEKNIDYLNLILNSYLLSIVVIENKVHLSLVMIKQRGLYFIQN